MKAQIWVETVVYTLIGIAIIGTVLAIITPRINEIKDKNLIEQSISMLTELDKVIMEVRQSAGNVRVPELTIKRGDLYIDSENNSIIWILEDSAHVYSQPGQVISVGSIKALTTEKGKKARIELKIEYDNIDLKFNGEEQKKQLSPAPVPYKISISNSGISDGKNLIDIKQVS